MSVRPRNPEDSVDLLSGGASSPVIVRDGNSERQHPRVGVGFEFPQSH